MGFVMCENVLVTSWNWVYLADFASFKPTYIPDDDPSDFSFFFDTGGRRLCYLAPERFYEHRSDVPLEPDAPLEPSMDIFAMGCVIAEVFLEGHPLFELSQLLAYRRGQYDPSQQLEKIPDPGIRKMILHMIQLNPDERLSAEGYLVNYVGTAFPNYFSPFLHDFYSCLGSLDPDARVGMCHSTFHEIVTQMTSSESSDEMSKGLEESPSSAIGKTSEESVTNEVPRHLRGSLRKDDLTNGSAHEHYELLAHLGNILREVKKPSNNFSSNTVQEDATTRFDSVQKLEDKNQHASNRFLQSISDVFKRSERAFLKKMTIDELKSLMSEYDPEVDTYLMPFQNPPQKAVTCEGMVLITSLLCSCLRNVKFPQLRRTCILLLKSLSVYINDEDCLQRVLPYVVFMLSDPSAIVRSAAIETLCDILPLIREFPPSDAKVFPEYILPMLSMFPDDPEESVRVCYASNVSKLALTSYGFLVHSLRMRGAGVKNGNAQLAHLRKSVIEVVQELVMGPKQTPSIRRALLQNIPGLRCFLGQRQCNEFLLPILPAFLNDNNDLLRIVFYEQIVYVCFFVGQRSVEEYLLPFIEQALSDTAEGVIAGTLDCLTVLCCNRFLRKRVLVEMIQRAFPLLCYPSQWVRRSIAAFIAASSESLGVVDSYVFLAPVVRPFLRRQLASLGSERALLSCLKPPVSRKVFYQVLENARGLDMLERQQKIWHASVQHKQWETTDSPKKGDEELKQMERTEVKLRALGCYFHGGAPCRLDLSNNHISSEKLRFSGLISPQLSGRTSFLQDNSYENIPLYCFSLDKREVLDNNSMVGSSFYTAPNPVASCSFNVPCGTKQFHFHRVIHEPEPKESGQMSYINGKFQDAGISSTVRGSSVLVEDTEKAGPPTATLSWVSTLPDPGWKPRGVLIAHLQEHRRSVNDISVSTDEKFFVSVSDDGTVKLWESRKLEKNISFQSSVTYSLEGGRGLCATMLRGSSQVAVGACDGRIHTFFVDYDPNVADKLSDIADVKRKETGEGAILHIVNSGKAYGGGDETTLMYTTRGCGIHLWDTRTRKNSWTLKAAPEEGYVSKLVTDPCGNWFVWGTSRGVLSLWDLRFLIPVNSWAYPRVCQVEDMCLYVPPPNAVVGTTTARPLIYVAAGANEVSLWNAETGSCHQVFQVPVNNGEEEMSDLPWALSGPPVKENHKSHSGQKYRVDEFSEPSPRIPGFQSLLPLPGGDLLTGGTDLKIRRWDQCRPERSYCICGPTVDGAGNDEVYEIKSSSGVQLVQEMRRGETSKLNTKAILRAAATDRGGCHRDSILSLASIKLSQTLLISSSRDGAIKAWK